MNIKIRPYVLSIISIAIVILIFSYVYPRVSIVDVGIVLAGLGVVLAMLIEWLLRKVQKKKEE